MDLSLFCKAGTRWKPQGGIHGSLSVPLQEGLIRLNDTAGSRRSFRAIKEPNAVKAATLARQLLDQTASISPRGVGEGRWGILVWRICGKSAASISLQQRFLEPTVHFRLA